MKVKEVSLLLSCPLSESQIKWIAQIARIRIILAFRSQCKVIKSVKSFNPCKSVMQTIYDIVKAHAGELKNESKEGEGSEFAIELPIV